MRVKTMDTLVFLEFINKIYKFVFLKSQAPSNASSK